MTEKPTVLFVCVHNAGRSQMAAGYVRHLAGDRIEVLSAGSEPADQLNPVAVEAMLEDGVDITTANPTVVTPEAVRSSDVVITMGCGDACPFYPGKRYEDWKLDDPAGQGIATVRVIREDVKRRVQDLIRDLVDPSWHGLESERQPGPRCSKPSELDLVVRLHQTREDVPGREYGSTRPSR
jgi:protein-tyrosine-phosphatase